MTSASAKQKQFLPEKGQQRGQAQGWGPLPRGGWAGGRESQQRKQTLGSWEVWSLEPWGAVTSYRGNTGGARDEVPRGSWAMLRATEPLKGLSQGVRYS